MTPFALASAFASAVILFGFTTISVWRFGWLKSYSSYADKWTAAVPMHNANLWSILTVVAAFLLVPAMLELGEGNPWQCLGFFAPLYLVVVGCTPEYNHKHQQRIVHIFGAIACAVIATAWICLVQHQLWTILVAAFVAWCIGYANATLKSCAVFWGEMTLFLAAYIAILI